MNITIGVYDLFTYAIPGSLYLTLLSYIGARTEWVDFQDVQTTSVPGFVAAVVVSYVLGHLTYGLSRLVERRLRWTRSRRSVERRLRWIHRRRSVEPVISFQAESLQREARRVFLLRQPDARRRSYVNADFGLLRAAIDLQHPEGAVEIRRLHAAGLMLRGSAPTLMLATLVAGAEIVFGDQPAFAACAAGLLLVSAAAATAQGWRLTLWANLKTLELAFWVPEIDRRLDLDHSTSDGRSDAQGDEVDQSNEETR